MVFPRSILIFILVSTLVLSLPAHTADLQRANELIEAGRAGEAFDLLFADIEAEAGTVEYDLLLGIAALESNHPTQAVFAFERVLVADPDNVRARLELARAYYEMGENEAAREEFTQTRARELPSGVDETIEEYLTAIDARLTAEDRLFRFFLEGQLGYDTNVNSATDTSQVALPAFGNLVFTLDDTSSELDSGFYRIRGGGSFSTRVGERDNLLAFGSAELNFRDTWEQTDFSTATADAQLGLRYMADDQNALTASVLGQTYQISGETHRNQGGVNLQWLHRTTGNTQYSMFGQWVVQRFPGQPVRNVNQYSGGVGLVHIFNRTGDPLVYASAFVGADDEINNARDDIGRNFIGFRAGGKYTYREGIDLVGGINYQYAWYGADDPLFLETRKDHFFFARAGVDFYYREKLKITPEVQYMNNGSTLPINDFDRWQLLVTARYDF